MKIQVTEEDIKNGTRESAVSCPIALAVQREVMSNHVSVDGSTMIEIEGTVGIVSPKVQLKIDEFISRFDTGNTVEPFDFDIDFPSFEYSDDIY